MIYNLYPVENIRYPLEFSPGRKWLHQKTNNKKNLLICIGDSWTWGDSLGKTTLEYNDEESRYEQFYTNRLAEKLNSDWLMIAWCGTNNDWIINQYEIIKKFIEQKYYKNYNKIYVHVCLTELFRELNQIKGINDVFKKKLVLIKDKTFKQFCDFYFNLTVLNKLKKLSPIPKSHIFSKNFWDIGVDCGQYNFVNNTWQQLLFEKTNIEDKEILPVVSGIGIDPLVSFLEENKLTDLKYDFSKILIKINKRVDNMIDCTLNHKKATKHPTREGHQIWADYLYNYYKDL